MLKIFPQKFRTILLIQLVGCLLSALCSGCATKGYLGDRMRDAGDVFTCNLGIGLGGKFRIGPLHAGLFVNHDMAGLRGGVLTSSWGEGDANFNVDVDTLVIPLSSLSESNLIFSIDLFLNEKIIDDERGKSYAAGSRFPFIALIEQDEISDEKMPYPAYYYSQIEVALGIGGSIRLGFNPGELVDLFLGWANIDIFTDDLGKRKSDINSQQTPLSVRDKVNAQGEAAEL